MLRRSIPRCTPSQQARQDKARAAGCIACRSDGNGNFCGATEIHHVTKSGRQISQDHTIALGSWHHRGICLNGYTTSAMTKKFGPSLAKGSKTFHMHYGNNDELIAYQNELIA